MKNKVLFLLAPIVLAFTSLAMADITLTAGDFVQNTDGTVTHTPTGLVWQACSVGQTWDGTNGTCTGTAKTYTYTDAMKVTSDFAGKTDWRVPNIVELNSIVDLKKYGPAINKSLFPQMPSTPYFWSSSLYASYPNDSAWPLNFQEGGPLSNAKGYNFSIRLVRGDSLPVSLLLKDFVDNKDGTVTHTKTGLIWQRCAIGQTWNNGGCDGKPTSYTQENAAKLTDNTGGKTDWRLPSYKELLTIVDYSQFTPATNSIVFPDSPSDRFWTSTLTAQSSSRAWFVHFNTGEGSYYDTQNGAFVKLVRGSMTTSTSVNSGGVDLSATISGMPNPATVNGNMTFTAILINKGTLTATDAKLSFALPKNSVSLVTKPTECSFTGLSVLCSVGSLAPSSSVTKSVTVKMAKAGGLTFGVTSWAAEKDTNTADNVARTTVAIRK
jgi:hypothetical protein